MRSIARLSWLLVLCGLLLFPALSLAQGSDTSQAGDQPPAAGEDGGPNTVTLSDKTLTFQGLTNEPLRRTLTLKVENGPIHAVTVTLQDLVDSNNGAVILSSDVTIDPTQAEEIADRQLFNVTIGGSNIRAGQYKGELRIWYAELEPGSPLTVPLSVSFEAVPQVDVETTSKNQIIHVELGALDFPYIGRPGASQAAKPLAEWPIYLVQKSPIQAEVQKATVLTMVGPEGQALPDNVVSVNTALPITLTGQDAAPLNVVVAGKNLAAGEYNGTMLIRIRNQAAPIEVPLKLLIKHGPLFPLLLLAASIFIGAFLAWYNTRGLGIRKYVTQIKRLDARLARGRDHLQNNEKAEAAGLLEQAQDAVLSGEDQETVEKWIKAVEDYLSQASSAADAFLQEVRSDTRVEQLKGVSLGTKVRDQLVSEWTEIAKTFEDGRYASLAEAGDHLQVVQQGSDALLEVQTMLSELMDKYPEQDREALKKSLNEASSLQEIKGIADTAASSIARHAPPSAAEAFSAAEADRVSYALSILDSVPEREREIEKKRAWNLFKLRTQTAGLFARLIVYLFALLVGWATLYLASPTFGSKPEDYITLFLWGTATNVIAGQTIDLKTIYRKEATEVSPGEVPAGS